MALITRRNLLIGSAAVGGALVLGIGYALAPFSRLGEARDLLQKDGSNLLVTWVKVTPDNRVVVIVPHSEMGQGVHTALPMMLAEEMDADWSLVTMEQAPAEMAFANGPLVKAFLSGGDAASVPQWLAGTTDFFGRKMAEYLTVQITGGSTSVRMTGVAGMRPAGAAARWMLVQAAAREWGVPAEEIQAAKSILSHSSGKTATYGQLAAKAADFDPPTNLPLKAKSEYQIIGRPVQRFDIPAKVTGEAAYAIDTRLPDMLYATVKACPVFGGTVKSFDASAVEGRRGIKAVMQVTNGIAVVADNTWRAIRAFDDITVEWEEGAGAAHSSESIFAGMEKAVIESDLADDFSFGDVEGATQGAVRTLEATYRVPWLAHATMEPMSCTASYKDGKLELWSGFQDPLGARASAATLTGMSMDNVTVHHTTMGGGFGRRAVMLASDPAEAPRYQANQLLQAIEIAKAVGVPVNLTWTREEDMTQDYYRNASVARVRAGVDANGKAVSWLYDYTEKHDPPDATWIPYGIPDRRARFANGTDPIPFGPWRSVDNSHHAFFIESFIDELAHEAGQDPVQYRLSLLGEAPRYKAVVEAVAALSRWDQPAPAGRARGIALKESFGSIVAEVAEVSLDESGQARVHHVWCVADPGEVVNPDTFAAQMESGIIYGLTAALYGEISIEAGRVVEQNFPDYEMVRMADAPQITVKLIESGAAIGGAGEPGTPPIGAAVANAVFSLTGKRIRELPLRKHDLRGNQQQARVQ
ncbi:MAG: molybdopterin-dependent oxidoreductase [Alphaproteobacteria bacterium]|nr:molybdopterin-dependent oxidoreductase [Alphaproteobacteria bacterium]